MKLYKVRMLPSAYADINDARNWYKQHNILLPKRFKIQLQLSIKKIKEAPFTHATRYKEIRIANIDIFPYAIHYMVIEDTIIVIAVYHSALSPEKWKNRS